MRVDDRGRFIIAMSLIHVQSFRSHSQVVLYTVIEDDFKYDKVMPSFLRWMSTNSNAGLVFLSSTDGNIFENAILEATGQLTRC